MRRVRAGVVDMLRSAVDDNEQSTNEIMFSLVVESVRLGSLSRVEALRRGRVHQEAHVEGRVVR